MCNFVGREVRLGGEHGDYPLEQRELVGARTAGSSAPAGPRRTDSSRALDEQRDTLVRALVEDAPDGQPVPPRGVDPEQLVAVLEARFEVAPARPRGSALIGARVRVDHDQLRAGRSGRIGAVVVREPARFGFEILPRDVALDAWVKAVAAVDDNEAAPDLMEPTCGAGMSAERRQHTGGDDELRRVAYGFGSWT
jgi:hypothetical protein